MSGVHRWGQLPPYPNQDAVTSLGQSQKNFTRDLYSFLARESEGNLFFSPFSVMTALGMAYVGAGGRTQQQMRSVLHLSENTQDIHSAFCDILTDMKSGSQFYELRTSNTAYIHDKLKVLSEYADTLKEKFLTSCRTVDFGAGETVRQEINAQVEKDTNSLIKNIIPQGMLNDLTRMVLVNALYFKGEWNEKFKEAATRKEDFWISPQSKKTTPMMHITEYFNYAHFPKLGAQVLDMGYKGSRLSMVFVLPDKYDGLAELEAKMSTMDLDELFKTGSRNVEATIPKFKMEESLSLAELLTKMGISDLFNGKACDLSGVSKSEDLVVSSVIHKAFLKVNEHGTEAAAATAMAVKFGCAASLEPPVPVKFIADHPFIFFIRDSHSGMTLFSGRLANP